MTTVPIKQPEHDSNLDVALDYISAAVPVFPCRAVEEIDYDGKTHLPKSPIPSNGLYSATTNARIVRELWKRNPGALVGIPTGSATGFFALDVDVANGKRGDESLAALEADNGPLSTVVVRTATGGRHLLFKHEKGLTNSTGALPEFLDCRGEGGYVIAAGSTFPDGTFYEFEGGLSPRDFLAFVAPAPSWLVGTIKHRAAAKEYHQPANDAIPVGASEIEEMLSFISPDVGYEDWIGVLMAIHAALGDEGLPIADAWSARGSKYRKGDVSSRWKGFKTGKGVSMGTVAQLARDGGADLSEIARRHRYAGDGTAEISTAIADAFIRKHHAKKAGSMPVVSQSMTRPSMPAAANDNEPLAFINPADWHGKPIPQRQWYSENLIPMRQVTILNGDGGVGKSLLALQIAAAGAMSIDTLDMAPLAGRTLYIGAEDEADEFQRRLADITQAHGRRLSDLSMFRLLPLADRDALLCTPDKAGNMQPTALWTTIVKEADKFNPQLIVLDTAADLFGGDEIKRGQVRQFIGMLRKVALSIGCAVVLLAHPSLEGMRSGSGSSGSTAWNNSVRSRLYLTRPDGKEADPDIRILKTMKANYGNTGGEIKLRWKAGAFILDDGKPSKGDAMLQAMATRVFKSLLRKINDSGDRVAKVKGTNYAPRVMAERPDAEGLSARALEGAMLSLLASGDLRIDMEGPPSKQRQRLVLVEGEQDD